MAKHASSTLHGIVEQYESEILAEWLRDLTRVISRRGVISEGELRSQATEFLNLFRRALRSENDNIESEHWQQVKEMLAHWPAIGAEQGRQRESAQAGQRRGIVIS